MRDDEDRLLPVREVAQRLACHGDTVRRWIAEGTLKAMKVGPTGRVRIRESEVRSQVRAGEPGE